MPATAAKPTIRDIARKLNVTPATVSRALNGHPAISDATRKAVLQTAKKLNYHPNKIASSLRLGTSKIIGVIIPSAEITFFGSVVHGIEKIASEHDYTVLLYQSNEQVAFEKKGILTFLRSRVDAVFASIAKETTDLSHFAELKKRGIPMILFDRASDQLHVPSVVVDDYKGAFIATTHLIEQGCRTIAHIAGPGHIPIFKQRLKGYKDALKKAGITYHAELVSTGSVSIESGSKCMKELLDVQEGIDGVFAVEDFTALGALQYLKSKNRKVPEEIGLVGFANEAFGEYITPSLSTINQQTIKMGEATARMFFGRMTKNHFYKEAPQKLMLEPELIVRESSRRK